MASLAELYGTAKAKARQIPANLRESGKGLASWAIDPYGEAQRVIGEYRNMTPEQRQGLVNAAVDLFGGIDVGPVGAIKASHGSPHAFTAFDFSKMGTGEGAQAYGHGGYFAQGFDSPVAQDYRATTAKGFNLPAGPIQGIAHMIALRGDKGEQMARKAYKYELGNTLDSTIEAAKKAIANNSYIYNVELKWPNSARETTDPLGENHLLDLDLPMNQQSPFIQKAIKHSELDYVVPSADGMRLIEELNYAFGPETASKYLMEAGIPGSQYWDNASRSAKTGTRNYVMFDDRFPNIVTRNGVSITDLLKNK